MLETNALSYLTIVYYKLASYSVWHRNQCDVVRQGAVDNAIRLKLIFS